MLKMSKCAPFEEKSNVISNVMAVKCLSKVGTLKTFTANSLNRCPVDCLAMINWDDRFLQVKHSVCSFRTLLFSKILGHWSVFGGNHICPQIPFPYWLHPAQDHLGAGLHPIYHQGRGRAHFVEVPVPHRGTTVKPTVSDQNFKYVVCVTRISGLLENWLCCFRSPH